MNPLLFLYHLLVVGALLYVVLNFLLNLLAAPRLYPAPPPEKAPLVSILVPARNEEVVIERCLRSLQAQDYPNFEIILLDDQSTDATGRIARQLGFSETQGKFRVINGTPLPAGWIGKPWACHQLSQAARGEYLLFTDADTDHAPFALSSTMVTALADGTDLLTIWPFQETKTWSERWIIPILFVACAGMVPHWFIRLGQTHPRVRAWLTPSQWRGLGVANGQYVLFKRSTYDRLGGHAAVGGHLVEDVALGRLVASKTGEGLILRNYDGTSLVRTRMYQNFPQLWEGFTKNIWPVFEGDFRFFVFGLSFQILFMVGPFLFLPFAGASHWMLLFEIFLIMLIRVVMTVHYRTSWLGVLVHPLAYLLATAIGINSYRQSRRKGLTWKGRSYEPTTQYDVTESVSGKPR